VEREKDVFEIADHLRQYALKAEKELEDAYREKEKEFEIEEYVEQLLEDMETIGEKRLAQIREQVEDEKLVGEWKNFLRRDEKAEKLLCQEELAELKDFLDEMHTVQEELVSDLGFVPIQEAPDDIRKLYWSCLKAKSEIEDAIAHRENEIELEGRAEKFLRRLESADKEEVKKFEEKIGDEELKQRCRSLWETTEKARSSLEEENYREVKNYIEKVREICKSIEYDLDHIERLEEKYEIKDKIGSGKNGTAYDLVSYEDRILKIGDGTLKMQKKMKKLLDQLPDNVNIVRVLEVGLFQGKPASVIERAPGEEVTLKGDRTRSPDIWRKRMNQFAEAPQQHFDRLVEDIETVLRHGLTPDGSVGNLFYSSNGFTLIDPLTENIVYREESGLDRERPWDYFRMVVGVSGEMPESITQEDLRNVSKIAKKLKRAGAPEPKKTVDESFQEFKSRYSSR